MCVCVSVCVIDLYFLLVSFRLVFGCCWLCVCAGCAVGVLCNTSMYGMLLGLLRFAAAAAAGVVVVVDCFALLFLHCFHCHSTNA